MNNSFFQFDSKEELVVSFANKIVAILKEVINSKGEAVLAVSGGSTPKPLFELLSKATLDWGKVTVTLVDERWVNSASKDSNELLVKENLLQNNAKKASFISLKNDASTPFEGLEKCNESFKSLAKSFDIIILGMGLDGHTASFFPKDVNLNRALTTIQTCAATIPSDAPHQRITLSLHKILEAKNIFLHIEGEAKLKVYQEALKDGAIEEMPIRAILKNQKQLEVYYAK